MYEWLKEQFDSWWWLWIPLCVWVLWVVAVCVHSARQVVVPRHGIVTMRALSVLGTSWDGIAERYKVPPGSLVVPPGGWEAPNVE